MNMFFMKDVNFLCKCNAHFGGAGDSQLHAKEAAT